MWGILGMKQSREDTKMKVIGVVGGIGSGKSTVVTLITETIKGYIINADHIGHEILRKGNGAYYPLLESFGKEILGEDGEVNRKKLGQIVFSDAKKLQQLNYITHPLIYQAVKNQISAISKTNLYDYIIVDAALLIEIKLIELVDEVWGVYAPLEVQINRIMQRDGFSYTEALKRIESQMAWDKIKPFVDIEINNSGDIKKTKEQIFSLLRQV